MLFVSTSLSLLLVPLCCCFSFQLYRPPRRLLTQQLNLVPLCTFKSDFTFLSADNNSQQHNAGRRLLDTDGKFREYSLSVVEETDLVDLARLTVEVFGTEVVRLGSGVGSLESTLMMPAVELVNGYSGMVAFAEVLAGLRSRIRDRLLPTDIRLPNLNSLPSRDEKIRKSSSSSLVLAIGKPKEGWESKIIASVELRLQPCDAKIPFSFPWIDRMERKLAALVGFEDRDLQPYLSNLCVDEKFRGLGLGRELVRVVEDIASSTWGYSKLYLHVDPDNAAAYRLYTSEGYKDVGLRWNPAWAGSSSSVAYLVKKLRSKQ